MKLLRFALTAVPLLSCVVAPGQSPSAKPDAMASLALMKALAGTWQGTVTTDSPAWTTDKPLPLTIRVASHGNALVHELDTGGPEVSILFVEGDHLALVHYCDFGNRPHIVSVAPRDGKSIEFDTSEAPGSDQIGHVSQAVFTIIDLNHHTEDWIFIPAGQKPVHAHLDFKRVAAAPAQASR